MSHLVTHREILRNVDRVYACDSEENYIKEAKKVLLSALLKYSGSICSSSLRPEINFLIQKNPSLCGDYTMGMSYQGIFGKRRRKDQVNRLIAFLMVWEDEIGFLGAVRPLGLQTKESLIFLLYIFLPTFLFYLSS